MRFGLVSIFPLGDFNFLKVWYNCRGLLLVAGLIFV